MQVRINKKSIRNILTIRYNPLDQPFIKPASPKDFQNTTSDPNGHKTEKLLKNIITKSLENKEGPFTISLSSGIDSTLCLALLRSCYPNKKLIGICAVFTKSFDESKRAREIAKKFDADFKVIKINSIFNNLPELISIAKKPRWNTYQHFIAKEAKKFSKILVTGDGADEIFGGYTFRYNKFLNLLKPRNNWKIKAINYLECHNRDWVPDQEYIFGKAIKFDWKEILNYFRPHFQNSLSPLKQVMLADFNGKLLHDFIPTGNLVLQHYNLKGFSMFLDKDIVKFALNLPTEQKYNQRRNMGKLILRKISKRFNVRHIEEKKGFSPDLVLDWNNYGKKIFESYIHEKECYIFKKNLINYNWVLRAFQRVEDDGDIRYLNRLISILALEIWYRIFITKEIKHSQKLR